MQKMIGVFTFGLACLLITGVCSSELDTKNNNGNTDSRRAPFVLVKDGVPQATIVIAEEKPTVAAQFAALELQHHIKLITGADIPIVDDKAKVDGIRILVGDSSATRILGFKLEDFKGEEYAVKFLPETIILMGRDTPIYEKVDYQQHKTFPQTHYQEKSTLWATYDFLEKFCGVRWYAPTDTGITFTPMNTLAIEPADIRRAPVMDAQRIIEVFTFYYEYDETLISKAFSARDGLMLKLRWRMTVRYGNTNHNVYSLWYKYWGKAKKPELAQQFIEKRPEYFARNYEGKSSDYLVGARSQYPDDSDLPPQVCMSNPDVIRHFAEEAVNGYKGKLDAGVRNSPVMPGCQWYYPIVEDDNTVVCRCESCRKLFPDKYEKERKSLLHYWWVNQIAAEAAKINPDVNISTLAYDNCMNYPNGLKLEPNVGVMMCFGINNWWHPTVYKQHHDIILKEWSENEGGKRLLQVWTYMLSPGWDAKIMFKYKDFFPAFYADKVGAIFKDFIAKGVRGWFGESTDELQYPLWTNQLEVYVAARICDNPELDTDKLIEEFFPMYYGAAAKPLREFYRIVEEAVWNKDNYPPEWFKSENNIDAFGRKVHGATAYAGFYPEEVCWGRIGTKERMDSLAVLMAEAKDLVKTDAEKQRFDWFDKGVWQPMLRGRAKYEALEKVRSLPAPEIIAGRIDNADGDPLKVNWDKATDTGEWGTVNALPDISGRYLRAARDNKFLYLKFFEPQGRDKLKFDDVSWAGDTLELFFSTNKTRPYYRFLVAPSGLTHAMAYRNGNGVDFYIKWDMESKTVNQFEANCWTVYSAIPLKDILGDGNVETADCLYANFFRRSPGVVASWSPTFSREVPTLERMGKILLK
jgi:hypothetical protein